MVIALVIAVVALSMVGKCSAAFKNSGHPAIQATTSSPPVSFQSPSHNLACRIIPDGPAAGVRCDAGTIDFTPPPPAACNEPSYGHSIGFAANAGPAVFMCVTDSLIDESLPVVDYGGQARGGSFTCTSAEDGITCRDDETGHGLQIERDSYQLF